MILSTQTPLKSETVALNQFSTISRLTHYTGDGLEQGHLEERTPTLVFSLLWFENYKSNMAGARTNLRKHLRWEILKCVGLFYDLFSKYDSQGQYRAKCFWSKTRVG